MSYTNQDQLDTTGNTNTGTFNKNQTGTADPFDNSRAATGGTHFGSSGDPNTFSNTGNTGSGMNQNQNQNQSSDTYGSGNRDTDRLDNNNRGTGTDTYGSNNNQNQNQNQSTDTYGSSNNQSSTGRTGFGSTGNDNANAGFGSGGNTDQFSAQSERDRRDIDDRQMGNSGNTMAGAGNDGDRSATGESGRYGNFATDSAHKDAPPAGFRGGANDPAYQPGQHYDLKRGVVGDDGNPIGGNTGISSGHNMPGHGTHHGMHQGNDNTQSGTAYSGTGTGTTGAQYAAREPDNQYGERKGYGNDDTLGSTGTGTGTGFGSSNTNNDNNLGSTGTGTGLNRGTGNNFGTTGMSNTNTSSGIGAGQNVNTTGGGEGWQSGTTGLTQEEIKAVHGGRHAPGAVEAHPNPNAMDSYDV